MYQDLMCAKITKYDKKNIIIDIETSLILLSAYLKDYITKISSKQRRRICVKLIDRYLPKN
jgi:ABC-type dipeptide/oligopeptide/nickel transport system ATPase subunit